MKKPESRLQRQIQEALKARVGGFWRKQWGGPFQAAGFPDLLGFVKGIPFALEVKRPKKGRISVIQFQTILELRSHGVRADIVESVEEAVRIVKWYLLVPLSNQSGGLWSSEKIRRAIHGARDREDTRRARRQRNKVSSEEGSAGAGGVPKVRRFRLVTRNP